MKRALPPSASIAHAQQDGKLFAPSAERNVQPLRDLLLRYAPRNGNALEIASGTGQHVCAFAEALPELNWQPSEIETERRVSIDAHAKEAGLSNVKPTIFLDAAVEGWGGEMTSKDLILLSNLLHLITNTEAQCVISEAAHALTQGGQLILYGPFKRSGVLTSAGDQSFDADLRAADPKIGYKDDLVILRWLSEAGLTDVETAEMPANNLAFIARRRST